MGLEEDLEYFKNGQLIDKAEYHALSKSLRIRVQLDESLPFEVWQRFNSHLMTAARAKVDLTIETRQDKPTILKLRAYLEYAQSIQPKLKLFESSMPRLEDKRIIYAFADAVMIDEAIQTKHLLEGFLKNVGIDLPILVQELKSETQQVEFKKPEAAPATVYEEK
ncbi:PolC-type DNA polymerase III N-terminal domain-containing protein, partial [Dielma fastidiosa]|uniref:PolC-type DNA polymerase III N-terminal domain-containing protein n=1 Tax=Dielma fastidiosa TaxID=1034346 RepID=UPI003C6C851F